MPIVYRFRDLNAAVAAVVVLVGVLLCGGALAACPPGNLLLNRAARSSRGVKDVGRLTDGVLAIEGDVPSSLGASRMTGLRPYVEWDLGEPVHVEAAAVQADNNDLYRITVSVDGNVYTPLWTLDELHDTGLRERTTRALDGIGRYVRFEALSGDTIYAASEVRVYCQIPDPWPPTRIVRETLPEDRVSTRLAQIESLKIVLGLCAFPLLFVFLPRLRRRARRALLAGLVAWSALSWIHFGYFQGRTPIHYWDMFHYFVGTKYFPELGYREIYRCTAAAERESGRGAEVDRVGFRDLDDNRMYPGEWTRSPEGRCRVQFSKDRWQSFRDDLNAFRGLFLNRNLSEAFGDHGFNATPLNVAWLRMFTHGVSPTLRHLTWLAQLDTLALIGTVSLLWWGFGALPAVVACLVLGIGFPWNYHWVGGSLGRDTWLVCDAAGFALLAKKRPFAGAVGLTLAGLIRLFPFVFVGGVGLWAVANIIRTRRVEVPVRRFLAGLTMTLIVGTATAGLAVGFDSYRGFSQVFERHSGSALSNHMGLSTLLGWRVGETSDARADTRLTDPFERWTLEEMHHRVEERPFWLFALLVSSAVIVAAAWQGATAVVCAALSGLLLFCALPMTSYDYSWLVLLVPLWKIRPAVLPRLLAFALFTEIAFVFGGESTLEEQHLLFSLACGALLLSVMPWRELVEGRSLMDPTAGHGGDHLGY